MAKKCLGLKCEDALSELLVFSVAYKARTLLDEAITQYRTVGMPKHLEMAERMLTST